ncbi:hypothetical protein ACU686_32690 [Yinghuangia aomiensis]
MLSRGRPVPRRRHAPPRRPASPGHRPRGRHRRTRPRRRPDRRAARPRPRRMGAEIRVRRPRPVAVRRRRGGRHTNRQRRPRRHTVRDKTVAAAIARRHGLPFPPTRFVAAADLLHRFDGGPLVVKPVAGDSGRGVHIVRSARDLREARGALHREGFLLVQPYVPNPGVDVEVYSVAGGLHATVRTSPLHPDRPVETREIRSRTTSPRSSPGSARCTTSTCSASTPSKARTAGRSSTSTTSRASAASPTRSRASPPRCCGLADARHAGSARAR